MFGLQHPDIMSLGACHIVLIGRRAVPASPATFSLNLHPEQNYASSCTQLQYRLERKIRGFHGDDYAECRLLGYKNSVRASQETYYVSATESSQLMLCKVFGFHGADYEECRLQGYKDAVRTSQDTLRLRYRAQPVNAM
jgi:hypothetical protein